MDTAQCGDRRPAPQAEPLASQLPRLAMGRTAVNNGHSHRIFCRKLSLRPYSVAAEEELYS